MGRLLEGLEQLPFFSKGCIRTNFQQERKVLDDRQRRKSLPSHAVSMAQFLRIAEGIPSIPYVFLVSATENAVNASLQGILRQKGLEMEGYC